MDVGYIEGDCVIEPVAPEQLYDSACLLRDNERFVVESVRSRATGDIAAVVSTSRLHNIAGKYTGKDDPVALVRTQGNFPGDRRDSVALSPGALRRRHDARQS
jgi:fructose 1,6-bisphosphate aldolase/phosphatase